MSSRLARLLRVGEHFLRSDRGGAFPSSCLILLLISFACVFPLGCTADPVQAGEFDGHSAFEILEKQCSFGPRVPGTNEHRMCREYLVGILKQYADRVEVQSFEVMIRGELLPLSNIIAYFGSEEQPEWLLSAHWDSRPTADRDPDPAKRSQPILGANDGASGVAVLLELARIFHEVPPNRSLIIVLFDGEDYGPKSDAMFLGAKYFARHLDENKAKYGILLDMVGDKQLTLPIEQNSYKAAPALVDYIWDTAQKFRFTAFERRVGYSISDDHLPLIQAGIPTVDIIDFDYPYWHTSADTPDKCSATSLYVVGQVVLSVVYGR